MFLIEIHLIILPLWSQMGFQRVNDREKVTFGGLDVRVVPLSQEPLAHASGGLVVVFECASRHPLHGLEIEAGFELGIVELLKNVRPVVAPNCTSDLVNPLQAAPRQVLQFGESTATERNERSK